MCSSTSSTCIDSSSEAVTGSVSHPAETARTTLRGRLAVFGCAPRRAVVSLLGLDLPGCKRPGEARNRLVRCDTTRSEAAPHKESWYVGAGGDRKADGANPLCPPAVRQSDHEQPGVASSVKHAVFPGPYENRLSDDSDHLLHEQRRPAQEPAGVSAPERWIGLGSE